MAVRARRFLTGMCALLAAGAGWAWFAGRWRPTEVGPEGQGWASGSRVRWSDEPYVEQGPNGELLEVRAGDEGVVVVDDSPIEFCVSFPSTGAFCPPRSSVVLIDEGR